MTTHPTWADLSAEVLDLLLDLPGDGLLDLLVREAALTATWLLPRRLLLEVSGAPPGSTPSLVAAGWRPGPCWSRLVDGPSRPAAAAAATAEVLRVLRDVLGAEPDDVEAWRPGVELDDETLEEPATLGQDALW